MWMDVPGFDDVQVTACGRVRTLPRKVWVEHPRTRPYWLHVKGKELSPFLSTKGYMVVTLRNRDPNAKCPQRPFGVHTLVCRAFHGEPPPGKPNALHRNDVKTDNSPGNLYWGSQADNGHDRTKNRRVRTGQRHQNAKLSDADVLYIRTHYKPRCKTMGAQALARKFNIHPGSVSNIINGWTRATG